MEGFTHPGVYQLLLISFSPSVNDNEEQCKADQDGTEDQQNTNQ